MQLQRWVTTLETKIYNIGFTGKTAEEFFTILLKNKIEILFDIRLNTTSQLAGFANSRHLPYLLKVHNIKYQYIADFAPTKEILDGYKKGIISWQEYEIRYNKLLDIRLNKTKLDAINFNNSVLLCSEQTDEFCHRRLACEFLKKIYPNMIIKGI